MKSKTIEAHGNRLFFCHIPKTAGITLGQILENHFHQDDIFPHAEWSSIPLTMRPQELQRYRFIRGHFYWHQVMDLFPEPPLGMTMLRNPIERILSGFDHIRRNQTHPSHQHIGGKTATLELFLQVATPTQYTNTHAVYLSAPSSSSESVREAVRPIKAIARRPDLYANLERAKENLQAMAFFGITEDFSRSMHLLSNAMGWEPITSFESKNIGADRTRVEEHDPDVIRYLTEINALDLELYEFGKRLFETRYAELINTLLWKNYNWQHGAADGRPEVCLNLADAIAGSGWHERETDPNGRTYRWMGPGNRATLNANIALSENMEICVELYHAVSHHLLESLVIKINGFSVPFACEFDPVRKATLLKGAFSRADVQSRDAITVIGFEVPETVSPHQLDATNHDMRRLAIAVCRVVLTRK